MQGQIQTQRQGTISPALQRLEGRLEEIGNLIGALEERLSPVMSPHSKSAPTQGAPAVQEQSAPLVDKLLSLGDLAGGFERRLTYVLDQLEL